MSELEGRVRPILTTLLEMTGGRPVRSLRAYRVYTAVGDFVPWLCGVGIALPQIEAIGGAVSAASVAGLGGASAAIAVGWLATGWAFQRAKVHERLPVVEACEAALKFQRNQIDTALAAYQPEPGPDGESRSFAYLQGMLSHVAASVKAIQGILERTEGWIPSRDVSAALTKELAAFAGHYPHLWQVPRAPEQKPKQARIAPRPGGRHVAQA